MVAGPMIERELAQIRANPRYGIDGADADLLQRELELLILQVSEFEAEDAQRRRKRKRHAARSSAHPDSANRTSN